jgi:hypothetical protein
MNGDELLAFLAARLDEDAVAATRSQSLRDKLNDPRRRIDPAIRNGAEYIWREAAVDPERMLREVDAKRAILDRHRNCDECPCDDVRDVASVYRGHPDFDSGWLPRRPAVTG